jgi:hypothetical protein
LAHIKSSPTRFAYMKEKAERENKRERERERGGGGGGKEGNR